MVKIKDIIERLKKNPGEYQEIRLLTAKRTLAFFLALYFTSFLFLIGGFSFLFVSLPLLSAIVYHSYSILIIVIGWAVYELAVYGAEIYTGGQKWPIIAGGIFSVIFVGFNLFVHLKDSIF